MFVTGYDFGTDFTYFVVIFLNIIMYEKLYSLPDEVTWKLTESFGYFGVMVTLLVP